MNTLKVNGGTVGDVAKTAPEANVEAADTAVVRVVVERFRSILEHFGATVDRAANETDHGDYLNVLDALKALDKIEVKLSLKNN